MSVWVDRFRVPEIGLVDWADAQPDRLVYTSTESGSWQVHTLDRRTGARRRVTDEAMGTKICRITPDGRTVLWFADDNGDESGAWMMQPFDGGPSRLLLEDVPRGWTEGISIAGDLIVVAISDASGFGVYVSESGSPAKEIRHSTESIALTAYDTLRCSSGLSSDGSLLVTQEAERGSQAHQSLAALEPLTGSVIGELFDEGMDLEPIAWSPVAGDQRIAIVHERQDLLRPSVWSPITGERADISLDLPGDVRPEAWWPDGSALLLIETREGRSLLYRYDLGSSHLERLQNVEGECVFARVRSDGEVWYQASSATSASKIHRIGGDPVLVAEGPAEPPSTAYEPWSFQGAAGRVTGWLAKPAGDPPYPVMMRVHGGPNWLDEDRWSLNGPEIQSYVDAGFLVAMTNYRGSTGRGRTWRDALLGNIGGPELEDVNAGLAQLVAAGLADPERAVIAGWSWGGYVTLLEIGKHPELWRAAVAGIPVGDYEAGQDKMSPSLLGFDKAILGGRPADVPALMRERNPINFVDNVRCPVLFLAGLNDSRCPVEQTTAYAERLEARGHPHQVYLFEAGHGSHVIDEDIRQQRTILEFLQANVPGIRVP